MSRHLNRKKIFIFEVEPEMQIFLSNLLNNSGFETVISDSGRWDMKKIKRVTPGLIILDVMLPRAEGMQIYRHLKYDEELKMIPVIMLSTIDKSVFFQYRRGPGSGSRRSLPEPDAYLKKPPEAGELLSMIRRLTDSSRSNGSSKSRWDGAT